MNADFCVNVWTEREKLTSSKIILSKTIKVDQKISVDHFVKTPYGVVYQWSTKACVEAIEALGNERMDWVREPRKY